MRATRRAERHWRLGLPPRRQDLRAQHDRRRGRARRPYFAAVAGPDPLATFDALFRLVCEERDAEAAFALWAEDDDVTLFGSEQADTARGRAEMRTHMEAIAGA